jgi:hypothetical protein
LEAEGTLKGIGLLNSSYLNFPYPVSTSYDFIAPLMTVDNSSSLSVDMLLAIAGVI